MKKRSKGGDEPRGLVTDHAVLRYMERIMGFDVEAIRREIEGERRELKAKIDLGASSVKRDDCVLVIRNKQVVTVLEAGGVVTIDPRGRVE